MGGIILWQQIKIESSVDLQERIQEQSEIVSLK